MLTETRIRNAKPADQPYKLTDGEGLLLLVRPATIRKPKGSKLWRLRYTFAGRENMLSLGSWPSVSLRMARERRGDARRMVARGIDPSSVRATEKAAGADTFEAVAAEWLEKQRSVLAERTTTKTTQLLALLAPRIGSRPVGSIRAPELLRALRAIESRGAHETASRCRQIAGRVFRYAVATGRADRDPAADLRGALTPASVKHRAAIIDPKEFAALLRTIEGYGGHPSTRAALRLMALLFPRPGELRLAEWQEFALDTEHPVWRIPADRMKMRREHLVPLPSQAVAILRELEPLTGHRPCVFESTRRGRPLSDNTLNYALRGMGYDGSTHVAHGFRTSASTLLHELGFDSAVIELQLAHADRNTVRGIYNRAERLPERRAMMQAWADYLDALKAGGDVVAIRG